MPIGGLIRLLSFTVFLTVLFIHGSLIKLNKKLIEKLKDKLIKPFSRWYNVNNWRARKMEELKQLLLEMQNDIKTINQSLERIESKIDNTEALNASRHIEINTKIDKYI